tara:strand:- start:2308 stop:2511 length:204 start_codon:yes stop_codon:yes gene_type:complete
MTVEYIGDGNSDGTVLGQSGEKIAFLGATPTAVVTIAQPASAANVAVLTAKVQVLLAELASKGLISL